MKCNHNRELSTFVMDFSYFRTNCALGVTNYFGNTPRRSVNVSLKREFIKILHLPIEFYKTVFCQTLRENITDFLFTALETLAMGKLKK